MSQKSCIKTIHAFLALVLMGSIIMLWACNSDQPDNNTQAASTFQEPIFSNEIPFTYDEHSVLTRDDFDGVTTITDLNNIYPVSAVRRNEGKYYTVYSLADSELAYVVFESDSNTGIDFYLYDIVVYPYSITEQEQELWFLLPQDHPENILQL
jgi:hypothetical protein